MLCMKYLLSFLIVNFYRYRHEAGVSSRGLRRGSRCDSQRLPPSNYLLPAFVQLWQIHSSSLFSLTALFTEIKDRRKHKAQRRVGARMFS